jgi:N12 class adenine-specific DNA methylase/2'-5' RNA ligase
MAILSPEEADALVAPKILSAADADNLVSSPSQSEVDSGAGPQYQFTPPETPTSGVKLNPYEQLRYEGYPDPSAQSFEDFQRTHPNPSMVTAQKLLPLADTPEKKEYLARFIQQKTAPELPVASTAGQAFEAFNQGPMSTLGIPEKLKEIQDLRLQNAEQTKLYNDSLAKLQANQVKKLTGQDVDMTDMAGVLPEHKAVQSKFVNFAIGATPAVVGLLDFFGSPMAAATGGAAAIPAEASRAVPVLQRAISLGFAAQMASALPDQTAELISEANKPADQRDWMKIGELVTGIASSGAFSAFAAAHGLTPGPGKAQIAAYKLGRELDRTPQQFQGNAPFPAPVVESATPAPAPAGSVTPSAPAVIPAPAAAPTVLPAPIPSVNYRVIGHDGKEYAGTQQQIREWISQGRVNAATPMFPPGGEAWAPAATHPDFAADLKPKEPYASTKPETAGLPEQPIRTPVGESPSLRQPGQAPDLQTPAAPTAPVVAAPKITAPEPDWRVTVQAPQPLTLEGQPTGKVVPGYVQIDKVTNGQNEWSRSPETLAQQGVTVPDFSKLPQGQYTYAEAEKLLNKPLETPKSSTQLTLPPAEAAPVVGFAKSIPDTEVFHKLDEKEKEDYGIETDPHITVLFGLTKHEPEPVAKIVATKKPITVTLGKLSVFDNPDYDVLKVDVHGKDLHDLNSEISKLPNEQTFKGYKPHMTIAYLKKGEGKKYEGDTRFEGQKLTFNSVTFSPPKEVRSKIGKPELPFQSPTENTKNVAASAPITDAALPPQSKSKKPTRIKIPAAKSEESIWKSVGYNSEGKELFEDQRGVRSIVENNIRRSEPVGLVPKREGGFGISTDRVAHPEYEVASKEKGQTATAPNVPKNVSIPQMQRELRAAGWIHAANSDAWLPANASKRFSNTAEAYAALKSGSVKNPELLPFIRKQADGWLVGLKNLYDNSVSHTELYPTDQEATKALKSLQETGEHPPLRPKAPEKVVAETTTENPKLAEIRAKREEIKARLIKKLGRTNVGGVDPEVAVIATELAVNYAQEGVVRFGDFARRVKAELPEIWESLKGYLHGAWTSAGQHAPEIDELNRADAAKTISEVDKEAPQEQVGSHEQPIEKAPAEETPAPTGAGSPSGESKTGAVGLPSSSEGGRNESSGTPRSGGDLRKPDVTRGLNQEPAKNYVITDEDQLGQGGLKQKVTDNLKAIALVKHYDAHPEDVASMTPETKRALVRYVGWGGLKSLFVEGHKDFGPEREALKNLLTPEEYAQARASIQDAHYTSQTIIQRGIYAALKRMGFTGGKMVEGGVGIGNFIGLLPEEWRNKTSYLGVERDPITAKIAQLLYPEAKIQNLGFQDANLNRDHFDASVGNPPFGNKAIYDKNFKESSKHTIHNYFIGKELELTRPGGIVAQVVSRYFLDSADPTAREHIAKLGEFLGAIRLPNTAFKENANTDVVTDLVFFKRVPKGTQTDTEWTKVVPYRDPKSGLTANLNKWIAAHPEMIIGDLSVGKNKMYGDESAINVIGNKNQDIGAELDKAVQNLPQNVYEKNTANDEERLSSPAVTADVPDGVRLGGYFISDGKLFQRQQDVNGQKSSMPVAEMKEATEQRIKAILPIRDALNRLIKAELDPASDEASVDKIRKELNRAYDSFKSKYGLLNSVANRRAFYDDADAMRVLGLERDYSAGIGKAAALKNGLEPVEPSAKKADIFERRVNAPYKEVTHVETPKEALSVSLNQRGGVDLDYMSELTGKSKEETIHELGDLIYKTPEGDYTSREQYLSGNVRKKLQDAEAAGPGFEKNVDALKAVIPKDIEPTDIIAPIGAPWIDAKDVSDFSKELTGSEPRVVVYLKSNGGWGFEHHDRSTASTQKWGTERMPFGDMMKLMLNGKPVIVYDVVDNPNGGEMRVVNQQQTELANAKASEVKDKWQDWIWSDKARRDRLHRIYNDNYNNYVDFKADGSHLTLPGSSKVINLLDHQKNVAWRGITNSGQGLLMDHVVGAGKTFASIAAMMEMRRLGRVRKWLVTVPNHLTGQWKEAFSILYPNSNVLAAKPSDFTKENRQKFFSKILTGDYDAVVMGHSSLKKLGTSPEVEKRILGEMLAEIVDTIKAMKEAEGSGGKKRGSRQVSALEKTKDTIEAKIKKLADISGRDTVANFEELGFDGMAIDELHEFKNLFYTTQMQNVAGMGTPAGSAKAFDLYLKLRYLQDRYGGKAPVIGMTGTPISNSLVEMFTMQRYLQPNVLKEMNLKTLDAWARVFADVRPVYEVDPTGTGYRMATRLANFQNVGELTAIYRNMADVITMNDLQAQEEAKGKRFPVPKVTGGKPNNLVSERTPDQANYFGVEEQQLDSDNKPIFDTEGNPVVAYPKGTILWRVDNMPDDPREDNMLKLTNDARKAGLDMRLINPSAKDDPSSKINVAVKNIYDTYKKWDKEKGTQLVFCDLSVPASARGKATAKSKVVGVLDIEGAPQDEKTVIADDADDTGTEQGISADELLADQSSFSVYDDMKEKLVKAGIPENQIAFIHDYDTPEKKMKLFKRVNDGDVRVLFGSTPKMGAGTNVQRRLVALHHMDAPWRPSDLEQREGRAIRQGNMFYEDALKKYPTPQDYDKDPNAFSVDINRYATALTYDTRMWQLIEHKAAGIEGFRRADRTTRKIEDIGGEAANASDMKAAASGDPLIQQELQLRNDANRLSLLKSAWSKNRNELQNRAHYLSDYQQRYDSRIKELDSRKAILEANSPKDAEGKPVFSMEMANGKTATEKGEPVTYVADMVREGKRGYLGKYRGFDISFEPSVSKGTVVETDAGGQQHRVIKDVTSITFYKGKANFSFGDRITSFVGDERLTGQGLFQRLDNYFEPSESDYTYAADKRDSEKKTLDEVQSELQKPFTKDAELVAARTKHEAVRTQLMDKKRKKFAPAPATGEALAKKLDNLKTGVGGGTQLHAFGIPALIWDKAIEAAQAVIRAGGTVFDAINAAIAHIRANHAEKFDEAGARAQIEGTLGEGDVTQVSGKNVGILSKEATPDLATDLGNAQKMFSDFNLPVERVEENDERGGTQLKTQFRFSPDGLNHDVDAMRLADALESELAKGDHANDLRLSNLRTSIANSIAHGDANAIARDGRPMISEAIQQRLFNLAQQPESAAGQLLALRGRSSFDPSGDLDKALNVGVHLQKLWSNSFGGEEIRPVMRKLLTAFREYFTPEEIKTALDPLKLPDVADRLVQLNQRDLGGRVYRAVQGRLKKKVGKTEATKRTRAMEDEAIEAIIRHAADLGHIEPEKPKNQKLTADEQLTLLSNPKVADRVQASTEQAVKDAENNAGWKAEMNNATTDEERASVIERRAAGEDPSDEMIEEGLNLPEYAHWKSLREDLLNYSPTTVKLVQDVINGRFKGARFKNPTVRPEDMRIDFKKLAVSPEAEVQRVFDAQVEAVKDLMSKATPETVDRITGIFKENIAEQLRRNREQVVDKMFAERKGPVKTADEEAIKRQINAGLLEDARLGNDSMIQRAAEKSPIRKLLPNISAIVEHILTSPRYKLEDIKADLAAMLVDRLKLTDEQAKTMSDLVYRSLEGTPDRPGPLKIAADKALKKVQESLTPKEKLVFGKGLTLWNKVERAVKAGLFDEGTVLQDLAKSNGWKIPSEAEKSQLKGWAEREMKLRQPTQRQIDDEKGDIDKARQKAEIATEQERIALIKKIQSGWSRLTMPIGFRNMFKGEVAKNNAKAVNEFVAANLLLKAGFYVRQFMDVALSSMPLNAVNRALAHTIERAQNDGGFSDKTVADVDASMREMVKARIESARATYRAMERTATGHTSRRILDRMTHSIAIFQRMQAKADDLEAKGNTAGARALRAATILQAGYRAAEVFDTMQAVGLEWQEMRHQLSTDLRKAGKSPAEVLAISDEIFGDLKNDMREAMKEAELIGSERGIPKDKKTIENDAWNLLKAKIYDKMQEATGSPVDYRNENEQLRELNSWNLPETGGVGGIIANTIKTIKSKTEEAGIPTGGLFSFGNAMGIAANRMLTFSGGGLFGGVGFGDSPWYQGARNRQQRRLEAVEGMAAIGSLIALAAAGRMIVQTQYPSNKAEKEKFIAEGHKINTIRFASDDGKGWVEYPIQMSPFSFIAGPIYMIGGIQKLLTDRAHEQQKLNEQAAKTGQPAGKVPTIDGKDIAGVLAQGAYGMLTGGRTASGAVQSFSDYGNFNLNKTVAGLAQPYIPGLPGWSEAARAMGATMDTKTATLLELLVPTPWSGHQRLNALGDPMSNPNDVQRVLQVMTGGIGAGHDETPTNSAYAALFNANFSIPQINPNKGYSIGGTYRPLTDPELTQYSNLRGQYLKSALAQLGPDATTPEVQAAYQQANGQALAAVGVTKTSGGQQTTVTATAGPSGVRRLSVARTSRPRLSLRHLRRPSASRLRLPSRRLKTLRLHNNHPKMRRPRLLS